MIFGLNKKTIFLFDGIGALLSLLLTGLVLPQFSDVLGLPKSLLYSLAIFPLVYSIYSLSCHFLVKNIQTWMLKAIILGNILYCLVSLSLIAICDKIETLGILLLLSEAVVVMLVVAIEIKVYKEPL